MAMASQAIMYFQKDGLRAVLLDISKSLGKDDEKGFRFLLHGELYKKELDKPLLDVFQHLEEKKKITQENIPWIIVDCLLCIGQIRLVKNCFGAECTGEHRKVPLHIDPFRRVLYKIGMNLNDEDELQSLIYLFKNDIPKSRQKKLECALDLFLYLEEKEIISKEETKVLQDNLKLIGRHDLSDELEELTEHDGSTVRNENVGPEAVVRVTPGYGREKTHPALMNKFSVMLKNSVVKGIHINRLNPPEEKQLLVCHEEDNRHDRNACIVSVPDSRRRKCRTVEGKIRIIEDISDGIVGSVPKEFNKAMRYALDRDCSVIAVKTGKPCPSFAPWPPMFHKGGGLVLPCTYIFNCHDDVRKTEVVMKLREALSGLEEDGGMSLITDL